MSDNSNFKTSLPQSYVYTMPIIVRVKSRSTASLIVSPESDKSSFNTATIVEISWTSGRRGKTPCGVCVSSILVLDDDAGLGCPESLRSVGSSSGSKRVGVCLDKNVLG
jgi:hypothetical protein